jgi:predicted RNA-binding Zn-ribbon protein involved in translation (DUF1610 family)
MTSKFTIDECPTCGSKKIRKVKKNWTGEVHGKKYDVPSLEYYECPVCHEKVYEREAMGRIQEKSPSLSHRHHKQAA